MPIEGQGGVTLSYVCPHCHRYPLEDYIWWVSSGHGMKQCNLWCAACGGSTNGRPRTESWSHKTARTGEKQKCFEHTAAPQGVCDNLINTLKIVAKRQDDGDSPVKMVVQGFQEKGRLKIWPGSEGSHHGDFAKSHGRRGRCVNPSSRQTFPEAVVLGRS